MSITLKEDKSLRLESYSLHDFVFEVVKAAKSGYSPVDTNDKYVQGFSSWFTCGMVHDDELTNEQRIVIGLSAKVENTDTKVEDKVVETTSTASVEQDQPKQETQTTPTLAKTTRTTKKSV